MTDQVRVVIKAEDQGGQKAISDFARGLEGAAVSAEKSASRQATSFAKVRAELEKANIAQRRSDAALFKAREEDSQKTVTALIDDARRLMAAQRKSALDSAAVFVAAERQKQAEVARISQQSREELARGLKQREADNARSIEVIRAQNEAARKAETAAALAEIRNRQSALVAAQASQSRLNSQFTGNLSGKSAAASASVFDSAGLTSFERAERLRVGRATTLAEDTLEDAVARRRAARTEAFLQQAEARRRARAREFEEAARAARSSATGAASSFVSGVGAAAGVGFGAGPLGAGIATALGVGFSSLQAIEFERANAALTAVTGSSAEAGQALAFVREQAERLGVSVTTLSLQYSRFEAAAKGTALEGGKTRDIFLAVTEAGQRLNLRAEQVEGSLNAISQIISKGSVQAEELRGQLGDRLPGAFGIMARALGVTTRELDKMLRTGEVLAADALPKFATELRKTFDTDANTRIQTTASQWQRLANEIKTAAAEAGNYFNAVSGPAAGGIATFFERGRDAAQLRQLGPDAERRFRQQRDAGLRNGAPFEDLSAFVARERGVLDLFNRRVEAATTGFNADSLLRPRARTTEDPRLPGLSGANGVTIRQGLTGLDLLTSGVTPAKADEASQSRSNGLSREVREIERERLRLAKERLEQYAPLERIDRNLLEDQALRNALLREELDTGRKVSATRRQQLKAEIEFFGTGGRSLEQLQDDGLSLDSQNATAQSLRAFRLSGSQRAGDIRFDTDNLGQNDLGTRIANEQRQIELESRRLLVGATQEQTSAILAEADAQMQLVEALITQQDLLSRDAVVGARRTLQQIERDSTNAATLISEAITQGFRSAEEAAARFATTGKFSIRDFVSSALADFARLTAQRGISSLLSFAGNALFGGAAGGISSVPTGGGLGSSLLGAGGIGGQFLGPGKADGGAVFGGTVYPVVERGKPEAFRSPRGDTYLIPPAGGGQVIPMNASGGGAAQTIALTLNIDARGATDPVAIQRAAKAAQREIAASFARKNSRGIVTAD